MSPGFSDAIEASTVGSLTRHHDTKFIIGFDFAVTLSSPEYFLRSFRHHFKTIDGPEMALVKQAQQMIPLITREISLGQYVCELVLGVNEFDVDLGVQINPVKQPIKSNSVGSGNMSHSRASSL